MKVILFLPYFNKLGLKNGKGSTLKNLELGKGVLVGCLNFIEKDLDSFPSVLVHFYK